MGTVFTILGGVAGLASFILWIISIIKAFKASDIVWGILNLLFVIPGLIYFFVKGHKQLGIYWLIAIIVGIVATVMGGGAQMMPSPV